MIDSKYLLDDEQMAQFIAHGYLQLQTDFSPQFHQTVLHKMSEVYKQEGNPGNNLVPRIPEVQQIFDHPTIRGALTSVLGPDYIMHAHRHGHYNRPGTSDGGWHKDNYWGNEKTRNHLPWSAMIFYYPQDVTGDMGPTGIMPGSQNRYKINKEEEINLPVVGKAGTFALITYDIWHRATANSSLNDRYMLKFLFFRLQAPKQPEWNNRRTEWQAPQNMLPVKDNSLLWEHVWSWMSGSPAWKSRSEQPGHLSAAGDGRSIDELAQALTGEDENEALNAAYALAATGQEGISTLVNGLKRSAPDVVEPRSFSVPRLSAHGLAAAGPQAIPALIEALDAEYENSDVRGLVAYALGEMGEHAGPAVPRLIELLQEESAFIRQHVVEALGMIKQPASLIVPAVSKALQDKDQYVRFTAGLALARLGPEAKEAVPALRHALYDSDIGVSMLSTPKADQGSRYVSAIAATALQRIRTNEALDVLLPYLQTARWCPVTTKVSTY
ncbi:phytanoyl-CoA dioxygenase [Paenibacillus mesophilus]|uniref:HEAT repeat domain-containing protein n=1 Tax=Paenibacillus mesophilus TaxID=2582849 RepID=UPI00110F3195|nr:HEAT repeat domain-containing protein [Paenibacillus mesophilus]TMV49987.1 phytanoyl-CoA dioxygenase [Paenibacillus mesophilus]